MALRALCDTFPNHPDWMEWYGAAAAAYRIFPTARHGNLRTVSVDPEFHLAAE